MTPGELKTEMEKLLLNRVVMHSYPDGSDVWASEQSGWADDPEIGHLEADDLMVALLRELGYGEAMDIYEAQTRWYA